MIGLVVVFPSPPPMIPVLLPIRALPASPSCGSDILSAAPPNLFLHRAHSDLPFPRPFVFLVSCCSSTSFYSWYCYSLVNFPGFGRSSRVSYLGDAPVAAAIVGCISSRRCCSVASSVLGASGFGSCLNSSTYRSSLFLMRSCNSHRSRRSRLAWAEFRLGLSVR